MCDAVGGADIRLSLNSKTDVLFRFARNHVPDEADNALRSNLITLHGLLRLMMAAAALVAGAGAMRPALSPEEEADLDAALIETYAKAGITNDPRP